MRKLCYVLLAATISLAACKKKYCFTCTTEITSGVSSLPPSTTQEYCDMTEDEIKDKEGTVNTTIQEGSKTIGVVQETTCVKKNK
jgi:hypothetical protein